MTEGMWAMLLLGIGIGCAWSQFIIAIAINKMPQSMCDYCEWFRKFKKPPQALK